MRSASHAERVPARTEEETVLGSERRPADRTNAADCGRRWRRMVVGYLKGRADCDDSWRWQGRRRRDHNAEMRVT